MAQTRTTQSVSRERMVTRLIARLTVARSCAAHAGGAARAATSNRIRSKTTTQSLMA